MLLGLKGSKVFLQPLGLSSTEDRRCMHRTAHNILCPKSNAGEVHVRLRVEGLVPRWFRACAPFGCFSKYGAPGNEGIYWIMQGLRGPFERPYRRDFEKIPHARSFIHQ